MVGEEPTWWVMGSSKTEPPRKTERQQKSASSSGQRSQTAGGSVPQQGAPSGGSQASDAVKIDNKIIDSIFRMNSGGDDDRWVIINPTAGGYYFERCDCQCEVQHRQQYRVPNRTNCIWAVSCRRQERNILGVYAEMPDLFAIALRGEDQRGEDYSFLCWEGECGMATAICFLVCPNRMLDYWTPSGRQSHQRVDSGGEEPGQRTWTVEPDYQEAEGEPRGDDSRHDDPQEALLGPGLAPEGRQLEREHEDLPDDGQRTGMDKYRGEIILWVE